MRHAILSSVETVLVAFVMECLQQCCTELHALQAMASLIVIQSTGYTKELFEGSLHVTLQCAQTGNFTGNYTVSRGTCVILPSSGAELSAELSLSELPEEAALFICFFMAPFFSALLAFPFFLFLEPPTVHCKERTKKGIIRHKHHFFPLTQNTGVKTTKKQPNT